MDELPRRGYTVQEVAEMYALRTEYVRALCRRGDIRALKIGREYRISQASLDLFEREREAVA